ncbi:type VI secretion protein ImpB [Glycocaulis profundi]|nr:type VI secretion protein ImpB [Glycocaulis profundi]
MRRPDRLEWLYMDFDGFFASVEQAMDRRLRGRPVGVIPSDNPAGTSCIAVSKEAKAAGVRTGTSCRDAKALCPDIVFRHQRPELYVRAHHALVGAVETCLPVAGAFSIDELAAPVDQRGARDPEGLSRDIKAALAAITPVVTASIGMASNAHLAKIVCKFEKPDGLTLLRPEDLPGPLLDLDRSAVPGLGKGIIARLDRAGIGDMRALWATQPKQLRAIWGSVAGERFWYALHGHAVEGERSKRSMFGHGRVLAPGSRTLTGARECSLYLAAKAVRRMRAEGYAAGRASLWIRLREESWSADAALRPAADDDQACLRAVRAIWSRAEAELPPRTSPGQVGVFFSDLWRGERQPDLFARADPRREALSAAVDSLNRRYSRALVSVGPLTPPAGGHAGGKIAFTRIPDYEDFQ